MIDWLNAQTTVNLHGFLRVSEERRRSCNWRKKLVIPCSPREPVLQPNCRRPNQVWHNVFQHNLICCRDFQNTAQHCELARFSAGFREMTEVPSLHPFGRIRHAIFVIIAFVVERHINVGISAAAVLVAAGKRDEGAVRIAAVDQMMAIFRSHWPSGNVARAHDCLARVLDKHRLARKHDNHFILGVMPVPLRRPSAGFEHNMACAQIRQPNSRSEPAPKPPLHLRIKRRWIAGSVAARNQFDVYFGHRLLLCFMWTNPNLLAMRCQ